MERDTMTESELEEIEELRSVLSELTGAHVALYDSAVILSYDDHGEAYELDGLERATHEQVLLELILTLPAKPEAFDAERTR